MGGRDGRGGGRGGDTRRDKDGDDALERCRERQREREREKELSKAREYERELPSLLSIMTQHPGLNRDGKNDFHLGGKGLDKGPGLDRGGLDRGGLDRGLDRDRGPGLDRGGDRGDRGLDRGDRDRGIDRGSDRDRGLGRNSDRDRESDRGRERDRGGLDRGADRDRGGLDRGSDRDRGGLDRGSERDRGGLDRGGLGRGGLDRDGGRGLGRGLDRGGGGGLDRGSERGLDRGGLDRGLERANDRSLDRGSERSFDRGSDGRGGERGGGGGFERASERALERGSHMERERDRDSRDAHSDRDYPIRGRDDRRPPPPPPEEKGYDSPYDGRRGREERSRYPEGLERGRYEEVPPAPLEEPRGLLDRRGLGGEPRNYPAEEPPPPRRGRRGGGGGGGGGGGVGGGVGGGSVGGGDRDGGRNSMESLRSRDRDREREPRDRERDPREWERERDLHEREPRGEREGDRRGRGGYERDEPRTSGSSMKGRDWETRDYTDSRREWDGRGRRGGPPPDWDVLHRGEWTDKEVALPLPHPLVPLEDEWNYLAGASGDWPAPADRRGWPEEWADHLGPPMGLTGPGLGGPGLGSGRQQPRMLPHRDEALIHLTRDVKEEMVLDDGLTHDDVPDKDLVLDMLEEKMATDGVKIEESLLKKVNEPESLLGKRTRDMDDVEKPEPKKLCLEEVVPAPLEEDLSDISDDDADEILNREDSETPSQIPPLLSSVASSGHTPVKEDSEREDRGAASANQETGRDSSDPRSMISSTIEERPPDEETIDNLDFEEISDEELDPEESKAGIADALGVDWASLVAESRPRIKPEIKPGSARRRWESHRVLMRLGVSFHFAGTQVAESVMAKIKEINTEAEKKKEDPEEGEDVSSNPDESIETSFLHPVAAIHVSLREKTAKRRALFSTAGPYKRALSARRDLAIRRQLCNLPVKENVSEIQQSPDQELYRLGVQLFERSL